MRVPVRIQRSASFGLVDGGAEAQPATAIAHNVVHTIGNAAGRCFIAQHQSPSLSDAIRYTFPRSRGPQTERPLMVKVRSVSSAGRLTVRGRSATSPERRIAL